MNLSKVTYFITSVAICCLMLVSLFLLIGQPSQSTRADPIDLFVTPAGGGDCSQATPCNLQTALSTANDYDNVFTAQGTYTGSGRAVVSITHSIALYGGWDGSPSGPVIRDPVSYITTLDGEGLRRVVYVTQSTSPTIDGFTITGGNASGLGGGKYDETEAGGGIYSVNASPLIQNNVISNNVASTLSGIRAFGGGIYIKNSATSAVVQNNQIISNTAGVGIRQGDGGGLFIEGTAVVQGNRFLENTACSNCNFAYGGGLFIGWTSDCVITNNTFQKNEAIRGGGMSLVWSAVQVDRNTITSAAVSVAFS